MYKVGITVAVGCLATSLASPLWDYVTNDDGAFSWYDTGEIIESTYFNVSTSGAWKGYLLNMTSQRWLDPSQFAGSIGNVWTHQLLVIVPDQLIYKDAAALWITGGGNDGAPNSLPSPDDEDVLVCASLAVTVGQVCAVLYQIPNAPIVYTVDPLKKPRSEDASVAFTWLQYMTIFPEQPEWVLYFPMTKAAIKAMDATTAFIANKTGSMLKCWVTAGASKRGATMWLTGAVGDPRIIGIVPIVFDALSFKETVQHMWRTLGNWTFAFTDYRNNNVTKYLNDGSSKMDHLAAVIDPLAYSVNLTMPKLVVDATGDEFFQVSYAGCGSWLALAACCTEFLSTRGVLKSTSCCAPPEPQVQDDHFWWDALPAPKYRMMVDNAEHSMATGALYLITGVFMWMIMKHTPSPHQFAHRGPLTLALRVAYSVTEPQAPLPG